MYRFQQRLGGHAQSILWTTDSVSLFSTSSDSVTYSTEMEHAMPPGVRLLSCCSAPMHIDKGSIYSAILQHLVDIQAFAISSIIDATNGG
jgi:hypothetical protein